MFLGLLFLGVIALNAVADRFWCRYLCPLGALLGLLSKVACCARWSARPVPPAAVAPAACRLGAIDKVTPSRRSRATPRPVPRRRRPRTLMRS